jgi:hypothetical protein
MQNNIIRKTFGVISITFLLLFFTFFIFSIVSGHMIRKDIELNGINSIGKYSSHRSWGKGENNYFSFIVEGVRYKGIVEEAPEDSIKNIGKFYRIRYSKRFKGNLNAFFDQEVKDTIEIVNAGFTDFDILSQDTIEGKERSLKKEFFIILGIH